jgi:hypothetical protein
MASSGKKKTTMAKIMREARLRERRADKQAKKDARKLSSLAGPELPAEAAFVEATEQSAPSASASSHDLNPAVRAM